jgi:hypothetical protein
MKVKTAGTSIYSEEVALEYKFYTCISIIALRFTTAGEFQTMGQGCQLLYHDPRLMTQSDSHQIVMWVAAIYSARSLGRDMAQYLVMDVKYYKRLALMSFASPLETWGQS